MRRLSSKRPPSATPSRVAVTVVGMATTRQRLGTRMAHWRSERLGDRNGALEIGGRDGTVEIGGKGDTTEVGGKGRATR
ncbi:Os03g0203900 [Oryza sativa Japonica Group]|uniref:Os03g0203900 protein n=1 Tax=Oryza sativa subsp. japonica TaxID=39947 RepID=A0A0P0VUH2_ORYSJ|nr:Os03g0203900 [Oryza sativa Japonica Group]